MTTLVPKNAAARLRRTETESSIGTRSTEPAVSQSEDCSSNMPDSQPTDRAADAGQTVPLSRRTSRTSSMNSLHSKFTSMVRSFNRGSYASELFHRTKTCPLHLTSSILPLTYQLPGPVMEWSRSRICCAIPPHPGWISLQFINATVGQRCNHDNTDCRISLHGTHSYNHQPRVPHPRLI